MDSLEILFPRSLVSLVIVFAMLFYSEPLEFLSLPRAAMIFAGTSQHPTGKL